MKKREANILTSVIGIIFCTLLIIGFVNSYFTLGNGIKEFEIHETAIKIYNQNEVENNPKISLLNELSAIPNHIYINRLPVENGDSRLPIVKFGYDNLFLEEIFSYRHLTRALVRELEKYPNLRIYCPESNTEFLIYKESDGSAIHRIVF